MVPFPHKKKRFTVILGCNEQIDVYVDFESISIEMAGGNNEYE